MTLQQKWNRFKAWVYHVTHNIKKGSSFFLHMEECTYCRNEFEAWRDSRPIRPSSHEQHHVGTRDKN